MLTKGDDLLLTRLKWQEKDHRISNDVREEEHDNGNPEQDENRLGQPPDNVPVHGFGA
jgi:hypothetical protein